jgi:hypothetical protein
LLWCSELKVERTFEQKSLDVCGGERALISSRALDGWL